MDRELGVAVGIGAREAQLLLLEQLEVVLARSDDELGVAIRPHHFGGILDHERRGNEGLRASDAEQAQADRDAAVTGGGGVLLGEVGGEASGRERQ